MTQIPVLPLQNPRHLFWVDGLGALISAFLLGIILHQVGSCIGQQCASDPFF